MSEKEKVFGIIQGQRSAESEQKDELLYVTSWRVVVAKTSSFSGGLAGMFGLAGAVIATVKGERERKKKEKIYRELSPKDVLMASADNWALPNFDVAEVKLWKSWGTVKLNIIIHDKKHKWAVKGLIPKKKGVKLEDYENILRPAFGDKLSVKK